MLRTVLFASLLSGCATFSNAKPIGEPGPIACISSTSAEQAWMEIDKYMRQVLEAQVAYSCGPLAPPPATLLAPQAPLVPPLR